MKKTGDCFIARDEEFRHATKKDTLRGTFASIGDVQQAKSLPYFWIQTTEQARKHQQRLRNTNIMKMFLSAFLLTTLRVSLVVACTISNDASGLGTVSMATIYGGGTAICDGDDACSFASIDGCDEVRCVGGSACKGAQISVREGGTVICDSDTAYYSYDTCGAVTITVYYGYGNNNNEGIENYYENASSNDSITVRCIGPYACNGASQYSPAMIDAGPEGVIFCDGQQGRTCQWADLTAMCVVCDGYCYATPTIGNLVSSVDQCYSPAPTAAPAAAPATPPSSCPWWLLWWPGCLNL